MVHESIVEMDEITDEAASTDRDQDDSLEISSDSDDSDDLRMDEDQMDLFNNNKTIPTIRQSSSEMTKKITKSKLESTINKSLTLRNPGELISDFYISNMNYAMRYSVEYIQSVARDLRRRREQSDSFINLDSTFVNNYDRSRLARSFSVDRLYAVRREHIRLDIIHFKIP